MRTATEAEGQPSPEPISSYPAPTSTYKRLIRRALSERMRVRIWSALASTPIIAEIYARFDSRARPLRVTRRTDLVIDGFPRSGNTYAVAAFDYANGPGQVTLSHHFHHVRQIQRAVRFGVPVIVLIRDPREVLGSMVQFSSAYTPTRILKSYEHFYARVLPLLGEVVIADFDEVTADFGAVIDKCNAKFGTAFQPYVLTRESEQVLTGTIERIAKVHSPDEFENRVSRPSEGRRSADQIVATLNAREQALLARAKALYDEVLAHSHADCGRP